MLPSLSNPRLNEDVVEEIFSTVYDTSRSTVPSLLLTNRLFYTLTRPFLYRCIGLNLATDSFMEKIQSLSVKSASPRYIRYRPDLEEHQKDLSDLGASHKERNKASEWSAIARLISQTTQLRSVTFSCGEAMPLVLVQSILNYPTTIHLNVTSWTRISPGTLHTDTAELALVGSPSLRSLQAIIYNPERNAQDLRMPAFWRLVRSAPNLQSLVLKIRCGGCLLGGSSQDLQEWAALASKFERTTLSRTPSSGLRSLRIRGSDLSEFKEGELSSLTTLDCTNDLDLQIFKSLSSLTRLTLRGRHSKSSYPTIDDRLISCSPLTSLCVVEWRQCLQLDTIIINHGPTLRSLAFHEFERIESTNPRDVLFADEILRIRDGCPQLEELSIDLNIPENPFPESDHLNTEIHQDIYDALSTFPSLRRLQLNFNLGIASYRSQRWASPGLRQLVPHADEKFVKQVWEAVNRGRTAQLAIQELRVAQGEAGREIGGGYPVDWVLWERGQHHWLKATTSERGDELDKVVISKYNDTPDFGDDLWRNTDGRKGL